MAEPPADKRQDHLIGSRIRRKEDARLLTGRGRFIADVRLPGETHAVFVRSPHAHARIVAIDTARALNAPGVRQVLIGDDAAADGLGGIPWEVPLPHAPDAPHGDPDVSPPQPVIAVGRVRYVGEIVAVVVAESQDQARDAAELVDVTYDALPAVTDTAAAARPGAPVVDPKFADNVCFRMDHGDAGATEQAFRGAAHVVRLDIVNQRLTANPMETRGYVGAYDAATGRYTLHVAAGKPHPIRDTMAAFVFDVPKDRIRVVAGDVGGGFGAKNVLYPEEALVLWAARRTGRPVRWIGGRDEGFISDIQGRDQVNRVEAALDGVGVILALRIDTIVNLGAYLSPRGVTPPSLSSRIATGCYRVPVYQLSIRAVLSHSVPTGPYRGAGLPEANFALERVIDIAAREMDLDPLEIRRRNLIAPEQLPYRTAVGTTIDSGAFVETMEKAWALADGDGFPARRARSAVAGRLRGIGLGYSVEICGLGINETATVECLPAGPVRLKIGTMSSGQSHETVFAQIVAERLGVPMGDIELVQGDTDAVATGNGTGASRSLIVGGSAALGAADKVADRGRAIAAAMLEAAIEDVVLEQGTFVVAGTDRSVSFGDVVRHAGGITETDTFDPVDYTFPHGCHVCEVDVDPETGSVRLLRYAVVDDCGVAVNPMVVEGQMHGGLAQGIGQALLERTVYDPPTGQLLSGSFMDYAMPRADDLPGFAMESNPTPCRHVPLGAKGAGEVGATAAPTSVVNAIVDALWHLGVRHIDMPATPERVLNAIRAGGRPRSPGGG